MDAIATTANAIATAANAKETLLIAVEGNIGTGKSTLLEKLMEKYADDPSIYIMQEPVDVCDTIKDSQGVTMLEKYYSDQTRYAFSFQMMAYISRIASIRAALKQKYRIIISERSVYTDSAVFAKMLFDDKKIEVAQNMFVGNQDAAVDDDADYDDYEDESDYEEQE